MTKHTFTGIDLNEVTHLSAFIGTHEGLFLIQLMH